jgi:O-antigen biosynthesis protein WbqP
VRLIRILDVAFSSVGLFFLLPLMSIIYFFGLFDTGAPIFRQERVGRNLKPFVLIKFRTMRIEAATVPSHLADSAQITRLGSFLRKSKLDELPQLWNVLRGDMSLVGPRPGLLTQTELIQARLSRGVLHFRPGITGLAQISGVDMSTPELLAETDARMLSDISVHNYVKLIFLTAIGKGGGDAMVIPPNEGGSDK